MSLQSSDILVKTSLALSHSAGPTVQTSQDKPPSHGITNFGTLDDQHVEEDTLRKHQTSPQIPRNGLNYMTNKKRKLILHFDARNTIFVADHSSRIKVEQALNTYIAGVVWGVADENRGWRCVSEKPSLRAPLDGAISWYKLQEKQIVSIASDRARLRQVLGDFTQSSVGQKFQPIFLKHLRLLEWPHADIKNLTVTGSDGRLYHYLLPSFLRLIEWLHCEERDFCVVFRTYGKDAPHIVRGTKQFLDGEHPDFPRSFPIAVNSVTERFLYSPDHGKLVYKISSNGADASNHSEIISDDLQIYRRWNNHRGFLSVIDDFDHWQHNEYHYTAGKPLWCDVTDDSLQHIIFDDNIRCADDDNIVNMREIRDGSVENLTKMEAAKYEDIFSVQADLLASTLDMQYFVSKVKLCEQNFDALLSDIRP